ncbi:MAG: endonuclease/exonuclease/phosphatase family protein [Chitinophagales bacterium]
MPFYPPIKNKSTREKARTAKGLLTLKDALQNEIPAKTFENLILATWNIRKFDSKRLDESLFYIAEIVSHFDLVAVQEVKDDLEGLNRLMKILGKWWKVVFTDVTEGSLGNRERMAFVYDSRKVTFGGLAGEVVLPEVKVDGAIKSLQKQLARTPFMVGFQAGWYRFVLVTVHLIYGKGTADPAERVAEAEKLSNFLAKRADKETAWSNNMVLLGDFNIFKPTNDTFQKIAANFYIPQELQALPSNVPQNKHYDQIAFRSPLKQEFLDAIAAGFPVKAGVFNFFEHVFTEEHEVEYISAMGERYDANSKGEPRDEAGKSKYYKTHWRTHELSDHLPMWIEIPTDRSERYLKGLVEESQVQPAARSLEAVPKTEKLKLEAIEQKYDGLS